MRSQEWVQECLERGSDQSVCSDANVRGNLRMIWVGGGGLIVMLKKAKIGL